MSEETEEPTWQYEIIDHNVTPDQEYVTLILDIWMGDRNDLATGIDRYIGVWRGSALETDEGEAINPSFEKHSWRRYVPEPKPDTLVWEKMESIKEVDRDAQSHQTESAALMSGSYFGYDSGIKEGQYESFLDAIDRLAENYEDESAWEAVNNWRSRILRKEK